MSELRPALMNLVVQLLCFCFFGLSTLATVAWATIVPYNVPLSNEHYSPTTSRVKNDNFTLGITRLADSLPAESVPAPWLDSHNTCTPESSYGRLDDRSSVCDPSGLLTPRQLDALNRKTYAVYQGSSPYSLVTCPPSSNSAEHGFRIAIITIRTIPYDGNSLPTRTKLYADAIFSHWNLQNNCGASILILIALDDRRLYIKTGSLAATFVTSNDINSMFQSMVTQLKQNDINSALDIAVTRISSLLRAYRPDHPYHPPPQTPAPKTGTAPSPQDRGPFGPLFFKSGPVWWDLELSLVVISSAICVIVACCHGFGGPDAAKLRREKKILLQKLDTVRTEYIRASMPQYDPASCPICQNDVSQLGDSYDDDDVDEGDPLTGQRVHGNSQVSENSPRPIQKFPCGHIFHNHCVESLSSKQTGCPVCDAGAPNVDVPSLSDSRDKDFSYRLARLHAEYPHLLTPSLYALLRDSNPTTWPDRLEESFLTRPSASTGRGYSEIGSGDATHWQGQDHRGWGGDRRGGGDIGGRLAAGALGAGAGWFLSSTLGHGQQQQEQGAQTRPEGWSSGTGEGASWSTSQIDSGNPSWVGQQSADDGSRGQGFGWGNAASSVSAAFGGMSGWGGGNSQDGGNGGNGGDGDGAGW